MVDQIQTATQGRTDTATESEAGERSAAIATLRRAERYDHVRVAPLDLSLRVLHQIGDFGVEGVRTTGDDTTYLLVAESDPELPDVRIDRYDGSTFRPVFRTSRVRVDDGGDERVFRVPAGVRVDRDRRTGGGRGRLQPDGGLTAVQTARELSVGDRVRVAGEEYDSMLATVDRVDDSPPVASELFAGARHVFLDTDADGERIRPNVAGRRDFSWCVENGCSTPCESDRVPAGIEESGLFPREILFGLRDCDRLNRAWLIDVEAFRTAVDADQLVGERHDRDDGTAAVYYPVADLVRAGCIRESWAAPYTGWV